MTVHIVLPLKCLVTLTALETVHRGTLFSSAAAAMYSFHMMIQSVIFLPTNSTFFACVIRIHMGFQIVCITRDIIAADTGIHRAVFTMSF